MNCLHCGQELTENQDSGWHRACIKNFFGTESLPEIAIDQASLEEIAQTSAKRGYTVAGVQKKISLNLHSHKNQSRLTIVDYPTGYILKPQVEQFEALPQAEHLVMNMAKTLGIKTVPHALIKDGTQMAYITKRIDREFTANASRKLAMEDFCQLDQRLTEDKYRGSYERCAKIISKYSSRPGLDMTELFIRLIFCFLTGNSDMHLKNFSLIEKEFASGQHILSPAYDLLPVQVIMPEDEEEFALTMRGKKSNFRRPDFLAYASYCGIPAKSAAKMIDTIIASQDKLTDLCRQSHLPQHMQNSLIHLTGKRAARLS